MNPTLQMPDQDDPSHDEQQLIAFHLGERCDEHAIRARLEHDPGFAALSEQIAHALRVFSADPVPQPDVEAAWQRLRTTLPPLEPAPAMRSAPLFLRFADRWFGLALAAALCLLLLAVGLYARHRRTPVKADSAGVIHLRPPRESAIPTGEADHLDRAERWLTVVNHTTAPLDPGTRAQGQQLLTENALYLQNARARGDLPDAAVLDRLDRVLTTANHPSEAGLQLRLDMNTDGLLFQLRILRQNQTALNGDPQ